MASEGFISDYLQLAQSSVDGTGIKAGLSFEAAYGLEIARRGLGLSAALYITQPASDMNRETQAIGSRLDLIPFGLLLCTIVAYGYAIVVAFRSACTH